MGEIKSLACYKCLRDKTESVFDISIEDSGFRGVVILHIGCRTHGKTLYVGPIADPAAGWDERLVHKEIH